MTMVSATFVDPDEELPAEIAESEFRILIAPHNSSGDTLEAMRYREGYCLTIDNPWAGSTEDGFGMNTSITLTLEQLERLVGWARQAKDVDAT